VKRTGVARIDAELIQIPDLAEETKIDFSFVAAEDEEPGVGHVLRRFLALLGELLQRLPRGKRAQPSDSQMPSLS